MIASTAQLAQSFRQLTDGYARELTKLTDFILPRPLIGLMLDYIGDVALEMNVNDYMSDIKSTGQHGTGGYLDAVTIVGRPDGVFTTILHSSNYGSCTGIMDGMIANLFNLIRADALTSVMSSTPFGRRVDINAITPPQQHTTRRIQWITSGDIALSITQIAYRGLSKFMRDMGYVAVDAMLDEE